MYGRRALQTEGTASAKSWWQERTCHALRKAGRLVFLDGGREGRRCERRGQGPGHRGPYGAWKGLQTSFLVLWKPPEDFN